MIKSSTCVFLSVFFLSSCSSHLAVLQKDKYNTSIALDEMRMELADVKHTLNNTQVEMQILEERVRGQDLSLQSSKTQSISLTSTSEQKISLIEKRISQIEKMQEKLSSELQRLSLHANQTTSTFSQYQGRIKQIESEIHHQTKMMEELSDLKSTLRSINKAIGSQPDTTLYKVKSGDTLEKIARLHKTSVESLKKANQLSSTKIMVGQEIKIPHGES